MLDAMKTCAPRRVGNRAIAIMYERETRPIRVAVKPAYLDDQSDPDDDRYVWSYTVTIENRGAETVQLLSRYWHITDGTGRVQEVRGPGVVGAQPVLGAGRELPIHQRLPAADRLGHDERPLPDEGRLGRGFRGRNPRLSAGKPLRAAANPLSALPARCGCNARLRVNRAFQSDFIASTENSPCHDLRQDRPSRDEAERAIRTLLRWAGDDPDREGLRDTPGPRGARLRGLVLRL